MITSNTFPVNSLGAEIHAFVGVTPETTKQMAPSSQPFLQPNSPRHCGPDIQHSANCDSRTRALSANWQPIIPSVWVRLRMRLCVCVCVRRALLSIYHSAGSVRIRFAAVVFCSSPRIYVVVCACPRFSHTAVLYIYIFSRCIYVCKCVFWMSE